MSPQTGGLMLYLLLTHATHSQGQCLQISMDRTPDIDFCGRLRCLADINQNDSHIFSIIGLSIFEVTQTNITTRLATVTVFDQDPNVNPLKTNVIDASGDVTRNYGDLTLAFRDEVDCLYQTFLCEMDFVNVDGQPDAIREVLTPGHPEQCPTMLNMMKKMAAQVKTHADDTERDLSEIKQQNEATETRLDRILLKLIRIHEYATSSGDIPLTTCVKGMSRKKPREKVKLWDNVMTVCDTETDGGGWIIIQRRTQGDVDFYRGWNDYKNGFGTPDTDFWIGNDIIHNLTSQGFTELRVDLEFQGSRSFAHYTNFVLGDEMSNYELTVGGYSGTAKDALNYHNGKSFSTYDRDNDLAVQNNAELYHGAWWYYDGYYCNLNGLWAAQNISGVVWHVGHRSASFTEMKIRLG